jgi:hypothetical protein
VEQVPLVPDQGPIQQFATAGLHPPFHDRVHSWHPDAAQYGGDAGVGEYRVEQRWEFAVPVADQEPGPAAGVLQVPWRGSWRPE